MIRLLDSHSQICLLVFYMLQVEDSLSGTTAIAALFHGGRLTVCNVGDSRAVLGHKIRKTEMEEEKVEIEDEWKEDKIMAVPLSRDQTPYRHDECERVKKAGASVMSVDQMEGSEPMHENWGDLYLGEDIDVTGDPPRVWVKDTDYPGTAFTRSIGDKVADGIGVTCEPEMLSMSLNHNDEMLILASDGVFEFLTNQAVIDIAASCATPVEACEKIVKAAYEQWLHYELRTDDITCIVMFISCDKEPAPGSATVEQLLALAKEGMKPMRINDRRAESQVMPGDFANDISQKILHGVENTEQGVVVVS
jgi:serine/threonine protein phosphatase PrpC